MVRSRARKRRPVNFSPHAPSIKANGLSPSAIASELSFLRFSTLLDGCIARHKWKNTSTADGRSIEVKFGMVGDCGCGNDKIGPLLATSYGSKDRI
ncbi:hypothetical protein TNIN_102711 [Trichonephila inaurata madagascariensis]|uniref:Uncharacterized protein n=1 Tax=Trichonephila inaurata madagascariensis TaxID=2747483 RepID=A0A8X6JAK5_9ARAC|nr:hypothetical protein TNIN_102711 [Trichonephila inaurata madagascariensis]